MKSTDPADLAEAIGVLAAVLDTDEDILSRTYVALATERHVPSLDLTALFRGADGTGYESAKAVS